MTTIAEAFALALQQHQAGNLPQAEQIYRQILQVQPNHLNALHLLGLLAYQTGRPTEAIEHIGRALRMAPQIADLHANLGNAYRALGRLDEALACYQRSLELDPNIAETHNNLGNSFQQQGKFAEAAACYEVALRLQPNQPQALMNLGTVLRQQGKHAEAWPYYQRAVELKPDFAEAIWNRSQLRLLQGDFVGGWADYEYRWDIEGSTRSRRQFWQPPWGGQPLAGRTILVYSEQGIGDEIMFASCLPELVEQAGRVIVACEPRLVPLFRRSFARAEVVSSMILDDDAAMRSLGAIDFQIPAGSVPRYTRQRLQNFPARGPYLIAAPQACAVWKERLAPLGPGLSVGISWRGGKDPRVIRERSVPLAQWAQLLQIPGVHFVNCQYGDAAEELENARQQLGLTIQHWPEIDPLKNMDDFAALISTLDLVISVDNSTVHLAGALGVPVWVALPFVPDWRWLLEREDSPWYPPMRLLRQTERGKWDDVFQRLAAALQQCLAERTSEEGGARENR